MQKIRGHRRTRGNKKKRRSCLPTPIVRRIVRHSRVGASVVGSSRANRGGERAGARGSALIPPVLETMEPSTCACFVTGGSGTARSNEARLGGIGPPWRGASRRRRRWRIIGDDRAGGGAAVVLRCGCASHGRRARVNADAGRRPAFCRRHRRRAAQRRPRRGGLGGRRRVHLDHHRRIRIVRGGRGGGVAAEPRFDRARDRVDARVVERVAVPGEMPWCRVRSGRALPTTPR